MFPAQKHAFKRGTKCRRSKNPYSKRDESDSELLKHIEEIYSTSKQRFGSPQIVAKLKEEGNNCNHKRVERIMKENKNPLKSSTKVQGNNKLKSRS